MPSINDLFTASTLLDYSGNREYKPFLGDSMFATRRVEALKLDQLTRGSKTPIIASVSAFDAEAEIGSRLTEKRAFELALIKRKMQVKETDLYALLNPRTPQEQTYLKDQVYNDFDVLNQGVLARVEAMSMEMLATGKIHLTDGNEKAVVDYQVPTEHQEAIADNTWDKLDAADPLTDMISWVDKMDVLPTRALTSKKIYRLITTNPKVLAAVYGKDTGRMLGQADFDAFMQAQGLPVIRTYDEKYKVEQADGTYKTKRYFPEDRIVLFGDDQLGEKVFGPTPEELANMSDIQGSITSNVYDMIYTESKDPVGTWEKATGLALPSFAAVDEVFQAQPIKLA
ncbi:major capsid protein [Lacticaseibacillus saniviri]